MKTNLLKTTLMIVLLAVAAGCNDDLGYTGGAECKGCGGATEVDGSTDPVDKEAAECKGCEPIDELNPKNCPTRVDLELMVEILAAGKDFIQYKTSVKNIGSDTSYMDNFDRRVGYHGFLSNDGESVEKWFCGAEAFHNTLAPGGVLSHTINCTSDFNPLEYRFLVVDLDYNPLVECNTRNNRVVIPL